VTTKITVGPRGKFIQVTEMDVKIELEDINIQMECLFPRNGQCCEGKFLKSCNSVLSKTVHRFINKDGKKFTKQFQPEISKQVKKNSSKIFPKSHTEY